MDRQTLLENALYIIGRAKKHQHKGGMVSSAKLALMDADHLLKRGDYQDAANRALTSLRFTVGITSKVYKDCAKLVQPQA